MGGIQIVMERENLVHLVKHPIVQWMIITIFVPPITTSNSNIPLPSTTNNDNKLQIPLFNGCSMEIPIEISAA